MFFKDEHIFGLAVNNVSTESKLFRNGTYSRVLFLFGMKL